jgi:D-alanyl-D-alanine carboxypeptidase
MLLAISLAALLTAGGATPSPISLPTLAPLPSGLSTPSAAATTPAAATAALTGDQMQKIDAIATQALVDQAAPGLALAVVRDGKVVYSRGYGYASIELQQGTRDTSLFETGSITKEFTAAAILALADSDKLSLDDQLSKYVPDFPRGKEITLRDLLGMTSGIPDYTDAPGFDQANTKPVSPADIIATVKQLPLDFDPGTQWEYSNTNYILLGMVIERIPGDGDYGSYVDTDIFTKLGMTATKYGDVGASSPDLATGYTFDGENFRLGTSWDLDWAYATGGVVSNVLDLAVWDAALPQDSLLSPPSLREMWSPVTLKDGTKIPYGYGWTIEAIDGHREIDTNGGLPGYNGRNAAFPNDRFDVVVLSNGQDFDAGPVVRQIFELFYPPTPDETAADQAGDAAASTRARDIFKRLQSGTLDATQLTTDAGRHLTPKLLGQAKSSIGKLGAPLKFEQTDKYLLGTETVYSYRLTFKAAALGYAVGLESDGRVGELSVWPL